MNYLDVYFSRINHYGETPAERRKNISIRNFERWLAESPYTVENLSVERQLYFDGIIETNKDREEKKIMFLYVALDIPIQVGDILNWTQDNGDLEKWILVQKEKYVHEPYQKFWIVKCNYEIKWIDASGRLRKSWSYVVSSTDDKIKGNFRTWHNLITPQPNKFAEILMPKPILQGNDKDQLMRGINFIIEDESWKVIECDWTSVSGVIYMSLTENKVNYQYDDRDIEVADTDRLVFPTLKQIYSQGEYIIPDFGENTFNEWEIELFPENETTCVSKGENAQYWRAEEAGQLILIMQLKDRKAVQKRYEIIIATSDEDFENMYIGGIPPEGYSGTYEDSMVKLDRTIAYGIYKDGILQSGTYEFSVDDDELATLEQIKDDEGQVLTDRIKVHGNKKNKLGTITLTASNGSYTWTKQIKIIPLW